MNPLMYLHRISRQRFASSAAHPDLVRRSKAGCVFLLFALAASGCALAQPSSAFMSLEQHINKRSQWKPRKGGSLVTSCASIKAGLWSMREGCRKQLRGSP